MKEIGIYVMVAGENPYELLDGDCDAYAIADYELARQKKSAADAEKETGGRGRWLILSVRPAKAGLDRAAKQITLVGDPLAGFRNDDRMLPAANFATFVSAWRWEKPKAAEGEKEYEDPPEIPAPSFERFDALHPNVADRITMALNRHLRPNIFADSDFLSTPGDSSKSS